MIHNIDMNDNDVAIVVCIGDKIFLKKVTMNEKHFTDHFHSLLGSFVRTLKAKNIKKYSYKFDEVFHRDDDMQIVWVEKVGFHIRNVEQSEAK